MNKRESERLTHIICELISFGLTAKQNEEIIRKMVYERGLEICTREKMGTFSGRRAKENARKLQSLEIIFNSAPSVLVPPPPSSPPLPLHIVGPVYFFSLFRSIFFCKLSTYVAFEKTTRDA